MKRETNEIRIKLHGTSVLSGGAEEGACGLPLSENTGFYMMEPSQKYDATYRAWTDADGRTWLDGGSAGCTVEVESLEVLRTKDAAPCIIANGSTMDLWGFYERVYSYLEIDLDAGTFRASARSLVIDNTEEKRENCFVAEGRAEKL